MKLVAFLAIALAFTACTSTKKTHNDKTSAVTNTVEYNFDVSLQTKLFVNEFKSELKDQETENFIPSKRLIEKYALKKSENGYLIRGYITKNELLDENHLILLGIKIEKTSSDIVTASLPLNSLQEFFELNGIKYFEINSKVELKN